MEQNTFFMVWNPNGYPPRVQHGDRASADREATRLARENPGQRFVVLMAMAEFIKDDVRMTEYVTMDDDLAIPF